MEKMPNNLVNDSDGDVADVKFCKNWYVNAPVV